ncbi:Type 1 glutamine amidotransferase-like domain-containing protein [Lysinibacillus sp. NPDC097231]|uniref:Type 1 glutamine amidotransferase-like domain-containing protein n=1 Tax=Lysinibacillus sp. NPDC097231 TaxID=3364142 RepID=UPI00380B7C72
MMRHIIAISGGGFSYETPSFIDEYIVQQIDSKEQIKICFIPTASNDAQGYIEKFYAAFEKYNPMHITQEEMMLDDIRGKILSQHILYVGGGDTKSLLEKWREHGFGDIVREAYQKGVILAGISAGAMCWFEQCYSENVDNIYEEFAGLGILKGTLCPHYDDPERKDMFDEWMATQDSLLAFTLRDSETLHFSDEILVAKIETY